METKKKYPFSRGRFSLFYIADKGVGLCRALTDLNLLAEEELLIGTGDEAGDEDDHNHAKN